MELEKVKLIKGRLTEKTDTENRCGCGDTDTHQTADRSKLQAGGRTPVSDV